MAGLQTCLLAWMQIGSLPGHCCLLLHVLTALVCFRNAPNRSRSLRMAWDHAEFLRIAPAQLGSFQFGGDRYRSFRLIPDHSRSLQVVPDNVSRLPQIIPDLAKTSLIPAVPGRSGSLCTNPSHSRPFHSASLS